MSLSEGEIAVLRDRMFEHLDRKIGANLAALQCEPESTEAASCFEVAGNEALRAAEIYTFLAVAQGDTPCLA